MIRRVLLALLALVALPACAEDNADSVSADPSFDRWCAGRLCEWESDGGVVQTDTWHKDDLAASFVSPGAQISQLLENTSAACFLFDTIADVDREAQLTLLIDFGDDGVQDVTQQLAGADWKSLFYTYPAPISYQSVRFTVRKAGTGRAVLAQLRVERVAACPSAPFTPSEATE